MNLPAMDDRKRIFLVVRLLQEVKAKGAFVGNPQKPYDKSPEVVYSAVRVALRYLRHSAPGKAQILALKIANRFKSAK